MTMDLHKIASRKLLHSEIGGKNGQDFKIFNHSKLLFSMNCLLIQNIVAHQAYNLQFPNLSFTFTFTFSVSRDVATTHQ